MQFTNRETTGRWLPHVAAAVSLGLFLTFLGPFRSAEAMPPGPRAIYWLALVATGYLLALAAFRLIGDKPRNAIVRAIAVAVIASVPQLFIVSWALVQIRPGRVIDLANFPMLFVSVLSIEAVIVGLQMWIGSGEKPRNNSAATAANSGQPRGRIPAALRGDLVALEAEDHYVRLHHGAGSTLILHRFGDALGELSPDAGLQVHRGWWVANGAVAGTFTRAGKRWLQLTNGLQVRSATPICAASPSRTGRASPPPRRRPNHTRTPASSPSAWARWWHIRRA